jgi:release factor glutamine methyltransferase
VLLAHVLGRPRAWVLAHPEAEVGGEGIEKYEGGLERLEGGEPLPYLLGRWEFFGLEFLVSPAALIPRPETELLVERALAWLRAHPERRRAADIGTGTGCIAVALGVHLPNLKIWASDLSLPALRLAQENARLNGVAGRVIFVQADLFGSYTGSQPPFDLLCANLPYIPTGTLRRLPVTRFEPRLALDGGEDGLEQIRRLLEEAPARLSPGGLALLEIEASQGEAACALARRAFPGGSVQLIPDLAGLDRLVQVEI